MPLEESIVWSVAETDDGSVWLGTGSNGRLLRIDRAGEVHREAEFEELMNGAQLKLDGSPNQLDRLYRRLKATPAVRSVTSNSR